MFWKWRILAIVEIAQNSLKRLLNPPQIISNYLHDFLCRSRVNWRRSKIGRFWAKSLGYSPWFWKGRILARPRNRSKLSERPPNPPKRVSNHFRDCLCRFRVNSVWSKIGRFWAKRQGYSPWFWKGRILASRRNRSKLSETPPKPS